MLDQMTFLTRLFKPADQLPPSLAMDLARLRKALSLLGTSEKDLGLRGFRLNLSIEGTSTYEELLALAPKIRAAVGQDKALALDRALGL